MGTDVAGGSVSDWRLHWWARYLYLALFAGQLIGGSAIWVWYSWPTEQPILLALVNLWIATGSLAFTSALFTLCCMEGGSKIVVILSRYLRQREREREQLRAEVRAEVRAEARAEVRAEARAEGRAEANAAAREWYERERANGEQFLDPPFMKDEDAENE